MLARLAGGWRLMRVITSSLRDLSKPGRLNDTDSPLPPIEGPRVLVSPDTLVLVSQTVALADRESQEQVLDWASAGDEKLRPWPCIGGYWEDPKDPCDPAGQGMLIGNRDLHLDLGYGTAGGKVISCAARAADRRRSHRHHSDVVISNFPPRPSQVYRMQVQQVQGILDASA